LKVDKNKLLIKKNSKLLR